jgi:hypothetical protein
MMKELDESKQLAQEDSNLEWSFSRRDDEVACGGATVGDLMK